jgi:hypothetical protein
MTPTILPEQPKRIDTFIKQKFQEANSAEGLQLAETAARTAALGFSSAANTRYAQYLQAFRSAPALTAKYKEKYPNSVFLPWPAFHQVKKSLQLWLDLPQHYTGAVPPEQLPWMEIFQLDPDDRMCPEDARKLAGEYENFGLYLEAAAISDDPDETMFMRVRDLQMAMRLMQRNTAMANAVMRAWRTASEQLFILAPGDAFNTQEDWLERSRKDIEAKALIKQAPDDPLAIHFCHGGALVVAAWGEEAAALNNITRELGI